MNKPITRLLSVILAGGGFLGIGTSALLAGKLLRSHWVYIFVVAALMAVYAWAVYNGIRLWRGNRRGLHWATILYASQIPILTLPGFTYEWYTGPTIKLLGGHVKSVISFALGASINFFVDTQINETIYGVNLFALAAFAYLFREVKGVGVRIPTKSATQSEPNRPGNPG